MITIFYLLIVICAVATEEDSPNIVLIYVDDFGYGDLQSYGHPTQEKGAIDELAEEGMRFTQWYSAAPVCSPSRAALLTGKLPIRVGAYGVKTPVFLYADSKGLPKSETTLAEVLKDSGYATGIVGKWHLGINEHVAGDGKHLPFHHGFTFVGTILPFTHDWPCDPNRFSISAMRDECFLYYNDTLIAQPYNPATLTDNLIHDAETFIRKSHKNKQPFFLYYSLPQTHVAMIRTEKFTNSSIRGPYGDNVNEMSWSVGEVVQTIKKLKIEDKTLILFISDHGPQVEVCGHGGSTGMLKGTKLTTWEGGIRVPAIAWWPSKIPKGSVSHQVVSTLDVFDTILDIIGGGSKTNHYTANTDGNSIKNILFEENTDKIHEILYFYCSDLLAAVRIDRYKIHFFTRFVDTRTMGRNCGGRDLTPHRNLMSSYNCHTMTKHDPPLIYDLNTDPGERFRLDPKYHRDLLERVANLIGQHRKNLKIAPSLFDSFDPRLKPCCNPPNCLCADRSGNGTMNVDVYEEIVNRAHGKSAAFRHSSDEL